MLDYPSIAGLILTTAGAGVLRGYSGFGGGLLMAPVFTMLVGSTQSVVLISIIHLLTGLQGMRQAVKIVDWPMLAPLAGAAVLSIPIGVILLGRLEPHATKVVVATIVLLFAAAIGNGFRLQSRSKWIAVPVGLISGILNGFCGIGGPPAVIYLLSDPRPSAKMRAALIVFFAILYPTTCALLGFSGLIEFSSAIIGALLAPVYFLGTEAGHLCFRRLHSRFFAPVCTLILCFSGLSLLLTA